MELINTHIVPSLEERQRLSTYLPGVFDELPSGKASKKAIKAEVVFVNGDQGFSHTWVHENDRIELYGKPQRITPNRLWIEVVFDSEDYAVVVKPPGIKVSGNEHRTLQNALPRVLRECKHKDALAMPRPVHRIDVPTSGLLLVAKTYSFLRYALELFETGRVSKTYHAIVEGACPVSGVIKEDLDGKNAESAFEKIETFSSVKNGRLSFVSLYPRTGRTHQLRKHMMSINHPIVGDKLYNRHGKLTGKGLFLAAVGLAFVNQQGERVSHEMETPPKFSSLIEREKRWLKRVQHREELSRMIMADEE